MAGISVKTSGASTLEKASKFIADELEKGVEVHRRIGIKLVALIQKGFKEGGLEKKWKPLSRLTIFARGGGTTPLRKTGRLMKSFSFDASKNEVRVGSADFRAAIHEFGVKKIPKGGGFLRPKKKKVLAFPHPDAPGGMAFATKVKHPGIPARPMLPSQKLADKTAVEITEMFVSDKAKEFRRRFQMGPR